MVAPSKGATTSGTEKCKYFKTHTGCHGGVSCEYLHILEDINRINEAEGKNTSEKEVQTEKSEVKDKDIQTEIEEKCLCNGEVLSNTVHIEHDKVVCILKRAKCTEEEWDEYEEKVESEMDFENC